MLTVSESLWTLEPRFKLIDCFVCAGHIGGYRLFVLSTIFRSNEYYRRNVVNFADRGNRVIGEFGRGHGSINFL